MTPIGPTYSNVSTAPVVPWTYTGTQRAICPDLLRISDIGAADGWRGRVVRAFFRILKVVTGV